MWRFSRKDERFVNVERPTAISGYNRHMPWEARVLVIRISTGQARDKHWRQEMVVGHLHFAFRRVTSVQNAWTRYRQIYPEQLTLESRWNIVLHYLTTYRYYVEPFERTGRRVVREWRKRLDSTALATW
uniref:Uncharacterized protein n=2 Tax=Cacopsylla melanoneura TaxID=428564 RepID=A0A8D8XV04_9HEMI